MALPAALWHMGAMSGDEDQDGSCNLRVAHQEYVRSIELGTGSTFACTPNPSIELSGFCFAFGQEAIRFAF